MEKETFSWTSTVKKGYIFNVQEPSRKPQAKQISFGLEGPEVGLKYG
jgi:hypothetical protein